MGTKTNDNHIVVEVDDRGRITIPKHVREKLGILSGDELELGIEDNELVLRSEHEGFVTASAEKEEWDDTNLDAGESLFGEP
ncbi:MAG: AbrB/MazE/SpoVT family DNA-binding domain-containing protein [Halobacteria archaeon]|nr:AbrB/MazE/SpoVT family DNA-binding domain-containing protein [Halobacteria archaeon]